MRDRAAAFAPGSVGNVGPGLDILGLAVAGAGDRVELVWRDDGEAVIADAGHPDLPTDPLGHAAAIAAEAVFARLGLRHGVTIRVEKGLPLAGGQGGSAASAVAGAVAANALAEGGLDRNALLECAMTAEAAVAGRHADNLAPALLGGLVLVRSVEPMEVIPLPVPPALRVVLVHPDQRLRTREARAVLPEHLPRHLALTQAANVATMVAGACLGDLRLIGRGLMDLIAEPVRAPLLPGFLPAKAAALAHGALGCSISGAGPTVFALVDDATTGERVAEAMMDAYREAGVHASGRVAEIDLIGARVE